MAKGQAEITQFEIARRKYRPDRVKFLLVAEAPPQLDSKRFFYFENVPAQDSLFIETIKVLYPQDCQDVSSVRAQKRRFLERFMRDGFYLIDACEEPIAKGASKAKQIESNLSSLLTKAGQFSGAKIILISATVYKGCCERMKEVGLNVINEALIDFPGSGGQVKFRNKITTLLRKHGYRAAYQTPSAGEALTI